MKWYWILLIAVAVLVIGYFIGKNAGKMKTAVKPVTGTTPATTTPLAADVTVVTDATGKKAALVSPR